MHINTTRSVCHQLKTHLRAIMTYHAQSMSINQNGILVMHAVQVRFWVKAIKVTNRKARQVTEVCREKKRNYWQQSIKGSWRFTTIKNERTQLMSQTLTI